MAQLNMVSLFMGEMLPSAKVTDFPPNITNAAETSAQPRRIPRHSIVYDPALQTLTFDATETLVVMAGMVKAIGDRSHVLTYPVRNEIFEVPLPAWCNAVDIFTDAERTNFLACAHLKNIGFLKNLQRRLGIDYYRLYVRSPAANPPPRDAFPSEREATESLFILPRSRAASSTSSLGTRVMERSSQDPSRRPSPARSRRPSATSLQVPS